MAQLSVAFKQVVTAGTGGSGGGLGLDRRVLVRTGGSFDANSPININSPGLGWSTQGVNVTFSGANDFTDTVQVFRNGQVQLTAATATADNDVYFVAVDDTLAFETSIQTNDVVQVWKFTETTASG